MFWVISCTNMWPGVPTEVQGTEANIHLSCVSGLQARERYSLKASSPVDLQHLDSCSRSRVTVPQLNTTANPAENGGAINKDWNQ